jgi:hypothetical protein
MLRIWLLPLSGIFFSWVVLAGEPGARTQLIGATPSGVPAKGNARLDLADGENLVLRWGKTELRIPYQKINTLEYGQSVSRRYAAAILVSPVLLLSKSHKHFVTLGYLDAGGKQQALVLRVDKGDIRGVLAGLEARTGRRVEYQDDEARKAGKG